MSQFDMDGNESQDERSRREAIRAYLFQKHKDGLVDTNRATHDLRKQHLWPATWSDNVEFKAQRREVEEAIKDLGKEGLPTGIKTEKPHQFRLIDWAKYEELEGNILMRQTGIDADIRVARSLCNLAMKKFPKKKKRLLSKLQPYLLPDAAD